MTTDEELDWSLIEFASQAAEMPKSSAEGRFDFLKPEPITKEDEQSTPPENAGDTPSEIPQLIDEEPVALLSERAAQAGKSDIYQKKQSRTPAEIAKMIQHVLLTMDGCPERGFVVTVYGSNPWNAMLMIRPEAGTAIDRSLWTSRVREIGLQLRDNFDAV
jgi:hypothetical protein